MLRSVLVIGAFSVIAAAFPQAASAQSYPAKPIRLLISDTPGSAPDILARRAGPDIAARMGQPWVVENRPGGSHLITAEACAKAAGDGYTLCITNITMLSNNPFVLSKLPYDPDRDFKPITNLFYLVEGFFARNALPVGSIEDLRAIALARPDALNMATLGPNTNSDIFRQWLNGFWKTNVAGIPYKGGSLIVGAVVAGEVDFTKIGAANTGPLIKAGKLKLLAFNSAQRLRNYPDVPTMDESGLGGFSVRSWMGLSAPAATPDAIVRRVNAEWVQQYRQPGFTEYMENQFLDPAVGTPEEFAAHLKADRERAGNLIRQFNIPRQ